MKKPFRLSQHEYLDYLLEYFSAEKLLDEIFRSLSVDQAAEITEGICRPWSIEYPDKVTEDDKFHRSIYK